MMSRNCLDIYHSVQVLIVLNSTGRILSSIKLYFKCRLKSTVTPIECSALPTGEVLPGSNLDWHFNVLMRSVLFLRLKFFRQDVKSKLKQPLSMVI